MERNDDDEQRRKKLEKGVYRADLFPTCDILNLFCVYFMRKRRNSAEIFLQGSIHGWINYTVFTEALKKVFAQQFLHPFHRHVLFLFWHL